ncbi:hypothetical protein F383_35575 [Gossypium arboreum]|uniref:Uncharacterized protein n=1 Tax=Gossypium arboreum TaxID=29729 RepID=A0A0B0PZU8_GOSAR|nr:hypothetical protein F383_35575 [Gossypium arboreum]
MSIQNKKRENQDWIGEKQK